MRSMLLLTTFLAAAVLTTGCSTGDASTGGNMFMNLKRKASNLKLALDGQEAKQSAFKKMMKGYSQFAIKEPVSTSPKLQYTILDEKKPGFIKHVQFQVHKKYEADFSDIPDFIVTPKDMNASENNMKPGTEYDLANLGPNFKIMDGRHNKDVDKVEFRPGCEYMLVFTIVADKSETVQIFFKTK